MNRPDPLTDRTLSAFDFELRLQGRDPERERAIARARAEQAEPDAETSDVARNLSRWPHGWFLAWALMFAAGMATFAAGYLALGPMLARWFAEH